MTSVGRASGAAAAIATIVLPVVALALRTQNPGWLVVVLLVCSPLLIAGYALAVVIAVSGFLSRRALFLPAQHRRATAAALIAAVSCLLAGVFVLDGGDTDPWGSPFTTALGQPQASDALASVSSAIATASIVLALAAFVWLFVEWVSAVRRRRRLAR